MMIQDPKHLTGIQKVAIVMLSLSENNAGLLFEQMSSEEINIVTHAMSNLGAASPALVHLVLEEFRKTLGSQTVVVGNVNNTKNILKKTFDDDKASKIIEDILGPQGKNTWEKLGNVNEEWLTMYIQNEHPQTAALIISRLLPHCAARVLSNINEEFATEVIIRMLKISSVKREVLDRVETILRSELITTIDKPHHKNSLETIADIFHSLDKENENKYMSILEKHAKEAAKKIKDLMFTFDDILNLTPQSVQKVVQIVDKSKLLMALKGASEDIRHFFFSNISQRAVKMFVEEMEDMGMVKVRNVLAAQSEIINTIKSMAAKGEVEIGINEKDEYIQ